MVKNLLATSLFLLAAQTGMAQNSYDTALELKSGENTYETTDDTTQKIYWKYVASESALVKFKNIDAWSSVTVEVATGTDAEPVKYNTVSIDYPEQGVAVQSGQTLYLSVSSYSAGTYGINLTGVTHPAGLGTGNSEDDPLQIVLGEEQVLGDFTKTSYSNYNTYSTYTPTEDGLLTLSTSYVSSLSADGSAVSGEYQSSTGTYSYLIPVTANTPCNIVVSHYSPYIISTSFSKPDQGSQDLPFTLVEGDNKVPAAAGTYYYTFTPAKTGYFTITGDETLEGGKVNIYTSKTRLNNGDVAASSATGTFATRVEVSYTSGMAYYVEVVKTTATEAEQTFQFEMKDYAQGETDENPFVIEVPSTNTLPNTNGTYYYSVTVPANTNKWLVVKAQSNSLGEQSSVLVYPSDDVYTTATGSSIVKYNVTSNSEATYIIAWTSSAETEPIVFDVYYDDVKDGDVITNPLQAKLGENTIVGEGTQYYTYTTTKAGKLSITVNNGQTVSFPRGTGAYDGEYEAIVSGNSYALEAEANTACLFMITNTAKDDVFTVEESEFGVGEVRSNPLSVEGDAITLTAEQAKSIWLKYNVKQTGMLTVYCDVPYYYQNSAQWGKTTDEDLSYIMGSDSEYNTIYQADMAVQEGDEVVVYIKMLNVEDGGKANVTFTLRDYAEGEDASKPFVLELNQPVTIPALSYSSTIPIWLKVTANGGEIVINTENSLTCYRYSSYEDAVNDYNGAYDYTENDYDNNIYNFVFNGEKGTDYYLKITSNWYDQQVTLTKNGDTDGIEAIDAAQNLADDTASAQIFSIDGQKVTDAAGTKTLKPGIYIRTAKTSDGATRSTKFVVR